MSYGTYTSTYTVVDIRKTFEGFEADLRMIARRTGKWTTEYVDKVFHDIIKLAEAKYLSTVSIVLVSTFETPIRAAKYSINENGTAISGDRAGGNDWPDLLNTGLRVILSYSNAWDLLSEQQRAQFKNEKLMLSWSTTSINNDFPSLSKTTAQTYASNGYQLSKHNFK